MKTYIEVPYAQKDNAKALGARWDMARKSWYVPDGVDLMKFKRWLPNDMGKYWSKLSKRSSKHL
jgi:hypothetical protein